MFNMQITKTQKIIGSIIILVALLGLYIVFDSKAKNAENNQTIATTTTTNLTATTTGGLQITTQGTGSYTIEQVSATSGTKLPQPVPDLTAKVIFKNDPSLTPEVKTLISGKVSALQTTLLKNPTDFDSWINLGLYQKMAGDYAAAAISWKYAGLLSPTSFVQFGNLGDLYAYYLKDNAQSEMYYKKAIVNGPTQSYLYVQLATVYRDVLKDIVKAKAVVDQGLSEVPNDPSLLQIQASLK
jgi:hypothetical protein